MLTVESGDVEAARELALSRIGTLNNTPRPLTYERCFVDVLLFRRCVVVGCRFEVVILTGCGAVAFSGRSAATPLRDQMQSLRQAEALPLRPFRCVQVTHMPLCHSSTA